MGASGAPKSARFDLTVDAEPAALGRAFLVYDLSGLSSFTGTVRSINGARRLGGYRPLLTVEGGIQVEEIPPAALHRGTNTIEFFPTSKDDISGYKVANLRVVFAPDSSGLPRDTAHPDIVISHPLHGECAGGAAYVRGFVTPAANASGLATVFIEGKAIPSALESDGSFSVAVQPPGRERSDFSFEVSAHYPDGTSVSRPVTVDGCDGGALDPAALSSPVHAKGTLVEDPGAPFGTVVHPWAPKTLSFGGATIEIPAGAVDKDVRITIRPLPSSQLAKMNEGMKNVTPGKSGYRFGPHGLTFKTPVTIKLPVDDALLPAGKEHDDVSAFYFDEQDYRWKAVSHARKDRKNAKSLQTSVDDARVASLTTHFTDFVNATLAVPEHPTAESFNENMMKDMKLGDPAAGVTLIEPPSANSFGSANLSYPIEVPPGRNGIQPELAIRYNSDNTQNGWLGVGWDLALPSIEVDTRFGAPAYDTASESESYLFDGEALAPTAKRDAPDPRSSGPTTFFRRVEGKFDSIVRFGTSPDTYYWVVTDQRGTKFTFGKTRPSGATDTSALLQSYPNPAPNKPRNPGVFRWYLESVEDTFGNRMDLKYFHDNGMSGSEPFTQTYPMEVDYTSNTPQSFSALYHVYFDLERSDPNAAPTIPPTGLQERCAATGDWCDEVVTGRPGFQVKTRFRLSDVRVVRGTSQVRRYDLSYVEGDFHKSLLHAIDQRGALGGVLGEHTFSYNLRGPNPSSGQFELFDGAKTWGTVQRSDGGLTHADDDMSGGSGEVGVGIGAQDLGFSISGGGGGFDGDETARMSFLDTTGDALPDFIDDNGGRSFSQLVPHSNTGSFVAQPASAALFGNLGHTDRSGWNIQGGVTLGIFNGAASYTHTTTDDGRIITDINGDGFPDLVHVDDDSNIRAALNDGHGDYGADKRCWSAFGCTDDPNAATEITNDDVTPSHPNRDNVFAAALHRIDPLVRWTAPFDGNVTISGPIQKLKEGGDGVVVEIFLVDQFDNFVPFGPEFPFLWHRTFVGTDTQACTPSADGVSCNGGALRVPVLAGYKIFTKLDGQNDTHRDDVKWSPTIQYDQATDPVQGTLRETYGPSVYSFSMKDDHRLAGLPEVPWVAFTKGTVRLLDAGGGPPTINRRTSDPLTIRITQRDENGVEKGFLPPIRLTGDPPAGATPLPIPDIQVEPKDTLVFRVAAEATADPDIQIPLDPTVIQWVPFVRYVNLCRTNPNTGSIDCGNVNACGPQNPTLPCHTDNDPLPNSPIPLDFVLQEAQVYYPFPQYLPPAPTVAATRATGSVQVDAAFLAPATMIAAIQGVNRTIFAKELQAGEAGGFSGSVDAGGELVVSVYSRDDVSGNPLTALASVNGQSVTVNFRHLDPEFIPPPFGVIPGGHVMSGGFHRWFFGDWDEDLWLSLGLPGSFSPGLIFMPLPGAQNFSSLLAPLEQGTTKVPAPLWIGRGAGEYIAPEQQNPGRLGGAASPGHGLGSIDALREASTSNANFGVSAILGVDYSQGETNSEHDFIDFNGDRFPDAVYMDGVRYGTGTTLGPKDPSHPIRFDFGDMRKIEHRTARAGANLDSDNKLINQTDSEGNNSKNVTTGFTVGVEYGLSATFVDLVDINGDGLPDHVKRDATDGADANRFQVELNLGHGFSEPMEWRTSPWAGTLSGSGLVSSIATKIINFFSTLESGKDFVSPNVVRLQDTAGDNLGGGATVVVSIGGSATDTQSRTFVDLVDVNGDGMPDQIFKDPDDTNSRDQFRVKLNLGDHFGAEQTWRLPDDWPVGTQDSRLLADIDGGFGDARALGFQRGDSTTESFSAKVCIGICVGGSAFHESGSTSSHLNFEDIDGDGKPDHVLKFSDDKIYYKRNNIDQSNLLVGVDRPLTGDHVGPNAPHTIALHYTRDGNRVSSPSTTFDMPNNQWVLTEVDVNDGQGNGYTTTVAYGDGFYNRAERENQGYDTVTSTRSDGSTVTERFVNGNQDVNISGVAVADSFYARGRLYDRVERDAAGDVFGRTETKWLLKGIVGNGTLVDMGDPSSLPGTAFPEDNTDTVALYEGNTTNADAPSKSTHHLRAYDGFGNVTDFTDFGEEGTSSDDAVYHVDYHNDPNLYVIRPQTVTAKDSAKNLLRQRDATYGPLHGELLTLTMKLVGGIDPTTNQPYSGNNNPVWSFTYDNFGNVQSVTSPDQHQVSYVYDDAAQTYRKQITDNNFGYVSTSTPNLDFGTVDTTTDINGQSEHFDYDQYGRLTQVFSPRDIGLSNPTIRIDYSLPAKVVSNGSPAYAVTHHKDEQHLTPAPFGDPIDTAVFIDGIKRVLQTKKDLEDDPGTGITTVGFAVSGKVHFDARGRVSDQSQPRFCTPAGDADCDAGDITQFIAKQRDRNPTHFLYDVLSRIFQVTNPDAGVTTTSYGFDSPPGDPVLRHTKTVTDPNGKVRVFYQSVRDEILAVQEHNTINGTGKDLVTQYAYDPLSELVTVNDAKNNPTTATYDTLGQMVSLVNRDTGTVSYRFDLAGNLAAKETPNLHAANQLIRRLYDHGRLTDIVYPTSTKVHFTYGPQDPTPGLPNDANGNVAGRISAIDDEGGHHEFLYGKMGELTQESRRLFSVRNEGSGTFNRICDSLNCDQDGNPLNKFETDCTKPPTYVTQYKRDSFDRLLELVYPDGEDMTYQYDFGGSLNSVTSTIPVPNTTQCQLAHAKPTNATYVSHIGYDEFGQRENIFLGNGVTTSYAYDPLMRRLTNVNTNRPDKDSHGNPIVVPLQRLAYTYDLVGNVLSMANNIPAPTQENFTGPTAFLFAYDDLYQVTAASATYTRETNNLHNEFRQSNLSLAYDEIGNITSKVQVDTDHIDSLTNVEDDTSRAWDYTYGAAGPHQVSQIKWRDPQPSPIHQTFNGAHRDYQYDLDGNDKRFDFIEKGETHSEADRLLTWNEEDRLRSASQDGIHIDDTTQNYLYDSDGTRTQRRIGSGGCPDETKYFNQYVVVQNDDVVSKHIYAGDTRIATTITNEETRECQEPQPVFYFHTDHLQSTEYLTDSAAKIAEHNEYFAFGETWIDERRDLDNDGRQDYLFTGKELDPETNLYYFGARYYDAQESRWASTEPLIPSYFSGQQGAGAYEPRNFSAYAYSWNSPVILREEQGDNPAIVIAAGVAFVSVMLATSDKEARNAAIGALAGPFIGKGLGVVLGRLGSAFGRFVGRGASAEGAAGGEILGPAGGGATPPMIEGPAPAPVEAPPTSIEPPPSTPTVAEPPQAPTGATPTEGPTVGDLRAAGAKDAHHIIQDAAVRDVPGYNTNAAPGTQLRGPANVRGTPHYKATQVQRQPGGGTYAAERRIGYKALRKAGASPEEARAAIGRADQYFRRLFVDPQTKTRIPGNR